MFPVIVFLCLLQKPFCILVFLSLGGYKMAIQINFNHLAKPGMRLFKHLKTQIVACDPSCP